jgi:hypothetical protein
MIYFLTSCLVLNAAQEPPLPKVERRMITISAQKVPEPSFRYVLIPPMADRHTGNAVQDYFRCLAPDTTHFMRQQNYTARLQAWLEQPYSLASRKAPPVSQGAIAKKTAAVEPTKDADGEDLPPKPLTYEEASIFVKYGALDDLDRGARATYADWGYLERIKVKGMSMLLPEVNTFYLFKQIVQTRARLHLMDGNYEKALYGLQTGYSIAQHLNDTNLIVCTMNGVNFATGMNNVVEEFIQQPGSPNLFWALAQLPRPLIDLNKAYLGDRLGLQYLYGDLAEMEKRVLTQAEMEVILKGPFKDAFRMYGAELGNWPTVVLKTYPDAKSWLKTKGWSTTDIEKMTSTQAVFLYGIGRYTILADEFLQGMYLPYSERFAHALKFDSKVKELAAQRDIAYFLGLYFFNPYPGLWVTIYQLDRHVAVLRCVEAIRHHVANSGNKLPGSWNEIKDLPIPVDPVTGQRFGYTVKSDHAEISVPAVPGAVNRMTAKVYEVYLK